MSKAILVMDMPKSCNGCCLCDFDLSNGLYCTPSGKYIDEKDCSKERPESCPLKKLPQKKNLNKLKGNVYVWSEGYNYCIDKILGVSRK